MRFRIVNGNEWAAFSLGVGGSGIYQPTMETTCFPISGVG